MRPLVLFGGFAGLFLIGIAIFMIWYFGSWKWRGKGLGQRLDPLKREEAKVVLSRWNVFDYLLLFPFAFAILFLVVDLMGALRDKPLYPNYYSGYLISGLIFVLLTFTFVYLRLMLTLRLSQNLVSTSTDQKHEPADADHSKQGIEKGQK